MIGELLPRRTDTRMTGVHLRGSAAAIPELLAGRIPLLPNVPTAVESGLSGFAFDNWFALLAPAGTPPALVERLSAVAGQVLRQPALVERMTGQGIIPAPTTPAEAQRLLANESRAFGEVIRAANIRAE